MASSFPFFKTRTQAWSYLQQLQLQCLQLRMLTTLRAVVLINAHFQFAADTACYAGMSVCAAVENQPTTSCSRTGTHLSSVQSRGSYRSLKRKIPRQTRFNKRKRLCDKENQSPSLDTELYKDKEDKTPNLTTPNRPLSPNYSSPLHEEVACSSIKEVEDDLLASKFDQFTSSDKQNEMELSKGPQRILFPGSKLTVDTSNAVLHTFMCRHHLTNQAKADLLRIMQIYLPGALIPSSVYTFEKSTNSSSNNLSPEVTEHHYCPSCKTILNNPLNLECPQEQCKKSLSYEKAPSFITVSIAGQLQCLFKRK